MSLKAYALSIMACPLADPQLTKALSNRSVEQSVADLKEWLSELQKRNPTFRFESPSNSRNAWVVADVTGPYSGRIGMRVVTASDLLALEGNLAHELHFEATRQKVDVLIPVMAVDISDDDLQPALTACMDAFEGTGDSFFVVEPAWAAAILIEGVRPFVDALMSAPPPGNAPSDVQLSFMEDRVVVRRSRSVLSSILGAVVDSPASYDQKLRALQQEEPHRGTILLCSTFLHPVTQSAAAVRRFYKAYEGSEETVRLTVEKMAWERSLWLRQVREGGRVDVIDRAQLEEYFWAPEYYQMALTKEELSEQVNNLISLLEQPNYQLCLTPVAVDLAYEIRGSEVRIRADRRNKAPPRAVGVTGLRLVDDGVRRAFEEDFWNLFRLTEPEFKSKPFIRNWLIERSRRYEGTQTIVLGPKPAYDVFLCHSSKDKPRVRELANQLRERGVKVWFDEWNLLPGRPWMRALEAELEAMACAAVCIGPSGSGPWMSFEIEGALQQFVRRGSAVIPVILEQVDNVPPLPVFLESMHAVDFRKSVPDPLQELERGVRAASAQHGLAGRSIREMTAR